MSILSVTLATGIFLVSISVLGQFYFPHPRKRQMNVEEHRPPSASEVECALNESLDAAKVCIH